MLCCFPGLSQEPANFWWGKETFARVDIYDLAEDLEGNYWISTNQGVFQYDGRDFINIPVSGSKSSSFFNLQTDSKGKVYFHNLSGQVFSVSNGKGELYYQMPDSLLSPDMNLLIDNRDQLIFRTKAIFKIESNKAPQLLVSPSTSQFVMVRAKDGSILLYDQDESTIFKLYDNEITVRKVFSDYYFPTYSMIPSDDQIFIYDRHFISALDADSLKRVGSFKPEMAYRGIQRTKRGFWARGDKQGIDVLSSLGPAVKGKKLFKNSFISAMLEDSEHNIVLGTFGSGLIFIPSGSTENIADLSFKSDLRKVTTGIDENLFITTISGEVFELDKQGRVNHVYEGQHGAYLIARWIDSREELWLFESGITRFNHALEEIEHMNVASVKDIHEVNPELFLLATNQGLVVLDFDNSRPDFLRGKVSFFSPFHWIAALSERINRIAYDATNRLVYAVTSNGLKIMNQTGEVTELKPNGISIPGKSIYCEGEDIFIGTQDHGLYQFRRGELVSHWRSPANVEKIVPFQDFLVLLTDNGIQIKDKNGETLKSFGMSNGMITTNVSDITVVDSLIWVAHPKGIQKINLSDFTAQETIPDLLISEIRVNGRKVASSTTNFSSSQGKFLYTLDSKSMKKKDDIHYLYKMEGIDQEWQKTSFYQNEIDYKSLPPGRYTFMAKILFKEREGKSISHSFTINQPFYRQWWFLTVFFVLIFLIGWLLFKVQLKRRLKEVNHQNELNLYQLKALRSQMNPHFMFNALNSIQEFIILNKKDDASNYLGKFSDLVRGYLNSSSNNKISIEEELDIIRTYLELEEIRFEDEFIFTIDFEVALESPHFLIPTMLIQPYIENSIKHGLLHKKGAKRLIISGHLLETSGGRLLHCIIQDNGIGRQRSKEIQQNKGIQHQSFATQANEDRLRLLNKSVNPEVGVVVTDVLGEEYQIAGTKVVLKIPIELSGKPELSSPKNHFSK